MKKKLVLVAAPPACGKTYVSELIAKSIREHIELMNKFGQRRLFCEFKCN